MKTEILDGNGATSRASYKLSEMSFIYPITPSSPMAETCDEMASRGEKNIFDSTVDVFEMQSEAGAIASLHGSALAGSVCTTFTSSQGLLLMIPNMYKIAGEMLPVVLNVASRSLATHSLNIFCDHSDVMSTRQTGFAMLASSNPQECYDFAVASFLTSMKSRIPFLHFFDGFRTSHQISNVNIFDDGELKSIYPYNSLKEFKERAISPNNPKQFGTCESEDIFFQGREKSNEAYANLPQQLESTFEQIKNLGGAEHHIMEYVGSKKAKFVVCALASACNTLANYVKFASDDEIGVLKINLYRPFDSKYMFEIMPKTVQKIATLDRTKEPGSLGEPLYLDVSSAVLEFGKKIKVFGGRYGLGGKEFDTAMAKAVFDNLKDESPKNHFTIGIDDDVTKTSLKYDKEFAIKENRQNFLFFGMGSDGTVSGAKNITKIIGQNTKNYVSAYFMYDSKKSGGLTRSYLSISPQKFNAPYLPKKCDIVVCNNQSYLKKYDIASFVKNGGILLINSSIKNLNEANEVLPDGLKFQLAKNNIALFSIDADAIANKNGLSGKISAIMQMAFFAIANIIPLKTAKSLTEKSIENAYKKKGQDMIDKNLRAINFDKSEIVKIEVEKLWQGAKDCKSIVGASKICVNDDVAEKDKEYYASYIKPILDLKGNELPVSKVNKYGTNKIGTSGYEKRDIATVLPKWDKTKCIQCGRCSFVCPHSVLRAKLLSDEQIKNAPNTLQSKKSILNKDLNFLIEVSPKDCVSCKLCSSVCPTKAIVMAERAQVADAELANYNYTKHLDSAVPQIANSPMKTQFLKPYFEFCGACAGCGETPYIKLLTQLFGDRLVIANATGCSSIYGGSAPACPYTKNKDGFGTAWANSLFEDNAEFGFGIAKSLSKRRNALVQFVQDNLQKFDLDFQNILIQWLNNLSNVEICQEIYLKLSKLKNQFVDTKYQQLKDKNNNEILYQFVFDHIDDITPKSTWIVGGDGWAYDIGFGGLDHVLASKQNLNILVLDTELYSNTGGQMSKASPMGAVEKFCADGKKTGKKNLSLYAIMQKDVYVAQVCFGADMNQTINAFVEAQNYDGVSIIIAYAPCINHGIDMSKNINQQIDAIKSGYWHLFRYNPALALQNKNPLTIDSPKPTANFEEHLLRERRFANYFEKSKSTDLFEKFKAQKDEFFDLLQHLKAMFEPSSK